MSMNLKLTKPTSVFCWTILTCSICYLLHSLENPETTLADVCNLPCKYPFKHIHSAKWPTTSGLCARLHSASKLICGCDMVDQQKDQWSNVGKKKSPQCSVLPIVSIDDSRIIDSLVRFQNIFFNIIRFLEIQYCPTQWWRSQSWNSPLELRHWSLPLITFS